MLKCIITMYELSQRAIAESAQTEKKITWAYIKTTLHQSIEKVKGTKFEVRHVTFARALIHDELTLSAVTFF